MGLIIRYSCWVAISVVAPHSIGAWPSHAYACDFQCGPNDQGFIERRSDQNGLVQSALAM